MKNDTPEIMVQELHGRAIDEAISMLSAALRFETETIGHGSREVLKQRLKNADRPSLRERLHVGE